MFNDVCFWTQIIAAPRLYAEAMAGENGWPEVILVKNECQVAHVTLSNSVWLVEDFKKREDI